ncbi:serine/threonine protein kinase [Actinoplanes sp. N902-109]|uniref:serine/threonine protein kinase n=1 Tax=Actinoplanes sp. (strain N902-109) TaxID=649831 RepID=UPI0003296302|nr:serine/threonine protein kinase [Actinoplanes sp. N902-109]AGL19122.1 serine/threonine protein kinase [Actinoplanes sp. N902-109]
MERGQLVGGRYRLIEQLGRGGMSVVWRADDDVLGREVAVKVLSAELADDPGQRRLIRAEAKTAARLRHANVVAVYDYGEVTEAGRTLSFVVMELVDGRTLADMLTAGPLPWKLAVLVGAQVAAALAAAHADGVVHRDVKPANVMVTSSGVKLVDFGISAATGEHDGQDGELLGTPAYLSPERIRGAPVLPSTDIYALGLLLHLALAGHMPWDASTVTQMVRAHVYADPAPLPFITGLPSAVTRLVSRCLAKEPADRPTAAHLTETLGRLAGLPSPALMRDAATPSGGTVTGGGAPAAGAPRNAAAPWINVAAPLRKAGASSRNAGAAFWRKAAASMRHASAATRPAPRAALAGLLTRPHPATRQRTVATPAARRTPARPAAGRGLPTSRRTKTLLLAAGLTAGLLTWGGTWWSGDDPGQTAAQAAEITAPCSPGPGCPGSAPAPSPTTATPSAPKTTTPVQKVALTAPAKTTTRPAREPAPRAAGKALAKPKPAPPAPPAPPAKHKKPHPKKPPKPPHGHGPHRP